MWMHGHTLVHILCDTDSTLLIFPPRKCRSQRHPSAPSSRHLRIPTPLKMTWRIVLEAIYETWQMLMEMYACTHAHTPCIHRNKRKKAYPLRITAFHPFPKCRYCPGRFSRTYLSPNSKYRPRVWHPWFGAWPCKWGWWVTSTTAWTASQHSLANTFTVHLIQNKCTCRCVWRV